MKVAIASTGKNRTSLIDSRFGRCQYFQIVDLDQPEEIKVFDNPGKSAQRGAGVVAGQFVADQGVEIIIAGNFGPNAVQVLESAGIKLVQRPVNLTVDQAVKELINAEK
jgi:predicted Fe-Mo cluster-binding NifX family protein